jgi:hypothetical protein
LNKKNFLCYLSARFGAGSYDFLLVKTDEFGVVIEASWALLPLLLVATLAIFISKKKLLCTHSKEM